MGLHYKREQFGRLFEEAARRLWIVASAIAPRDQVDDVIQESALIGMERFDTFEDGTNFAAWMTQVLRHVAANHARKNARRNGNRENADVLEHLPTPTGETRAPSTSSGLSAHVHEDFDDDVNLALRALPSDARACLLLHIVEGSTHAEIAALLDIATGTVASHIHRARMSLRTTLDPSQTKCSGARDGASRLIS